MEWWQLIPLPMSPWALIGAMETAAQATGQTETAQAATSIQEEMNRWLSPQAVGTAVQSAFVTVIQTTLQMIGQVIVWILPFVITAIAILGAAWLLWRWLKPRLMAIAEEYIGL